MIINRPPRDGDKEPRPSSIYPGLSHAEALAAAATLPPSLGLVDSLIHEGAFGLIVGPPEAFKTWVGLALVIRIGGLGGDILGRRVLQTGPAAAWLQDDTREALLDRIARYSTAHGVDDLPIRWHVNEGLVLPHDLSVLRLEIEREQQRCVLLDSLYNFVPVTAMRDEYAAEVGQRLKGLAAETRCVVAVVDHTPWASEGGRTQSRAYGSVFKGAAARFTLHLDRAGSKVWVDAHGNNITDLRRSPARFNEATCELELVGSAEDERTREEPPLRARVEAEMDADPDASKNQIVQRVGGNRQTVLRLVDEIRAGRAQGDEGAGSDADGS